MSHQRNENRQDAAKGSGQERTGPDHLLYKDDWPEAKKRFLALWSGEIVDRACLAVTAPNHEQRRVPTPANWQAKYTDIDYVIEATNIQMANTYFAGEAIPVASTFLGYAAYGGEAVFDERTIWVHPSISDWETPYVFDPENRWCRRFIEITQALIKDGQQGQCKYLLDPGGIHPPLDALMILRGSQNLCIDLIEHEDAVRATLSELMRAYKWLFEIRHRGIPEQHGWPCIGMWAPGRSGYAECDFSAMISPKQFDKFIPAEIEETASYLDYYIYHLDGANALQHLPTLLENEALHGIQWVAGAASRRASRALEWVPLCKQIQAAGKIVQLDVQYEEVEPLLRELDPRRLFVVTDAPSVEAAEELLRNAGRWSCSGSVSMSPNVKSGSGTKRTPDAK